MSNCKACGAELVWVRSEATGKRMPLDASTKERRVALVAPGANGELLAAVCDTYLSHFALCPEADSFRKEKA